MLVLGERAADETDAREQLLDAIASGRALDRFRAWVEAQGGDPRVADDFSLLPLASCRRDVTATTTGYVAAFDAEGVGRSAMLLGAGRASVDATIDLGAGLVLGVRVGEAVAPGTILCTMHAASAELLDAGEERFHRSIHFSDTPVIAPPLFHEL